MLKISNFIRPNFMKTKFVYFLLLTLIYFFALDFFSIIDGNYSDTSNTPLHYSQQTYSAE